MSIIKQGQSVIVTGAVAGDVRMFSTSAGRPYMKFGIKADYDPATRHSVFVDCVAWEPIVRLCGGLTSKEYVLAAGRLESREYNGKTYDTLNIDYICRENASTPIAHTLSPRFTELPDDDGELPF